MSRFGALGFVALASSVVAAKPAPTCMPAGDGRLAMRGDTVVLCTKPYNEYSKDPETCFEVTRTGLGKTITPPPPVATNSLGTAVVRDQAGALSACADVTCKPLGKKLVAAIDAARKAAAANSATVALEATDDLAVVIVDGKPWSLRTDAAIVLKPPAAYGKLADMLGGSAQVMGKLMVARWTKCAGPCEKSIVVDASGANRGTMFDAGPLLRIDDKRVAVISAQQYQTITILDFVTGKQLGVLDLGAGQDFPHAVRIDDHTFVMSLGAEFELSWIDVTKNTPKRIAGPVGVPKCP